MLLTRHPREPASDLLRRLEHEVGPLGALPARSVLSRAFFRIFIAALAMALLLLAWPYLPSEVRKVVVATTGSSTSANDDEISSLKESLANAEAANRVLMEELEEARSLRKTPSFWYEDMAGLTFRSPWHPRE